MTRVLILTASYGSGHNAAARSLAAAFEREQTAVTVVDHFRELVHPLFDRASRTLYHGLLRRAPFLWGVGYSLGDWMASDSFLTLGGTRLGTKRLAALLDRLAPPLVVPVPPTPPAALSAPPPPGDPRAPPPQGLQGLVLPGHDAGLRTALARLTNGTAIRTLGYVEDVRRLMAAADLLVTKAGGMTLAEAMAAETPLLLYGSLPGQERRNERFAARTGIALVARKRAELTSLLDHALRAPDLLKYLRARMRRLRRPDATRRIVETVLEGGAPHRDGESRDRQPRLVAPEPLALRAAADRRRDRTRPSAPL